MKLFFKILGIVVLVLILIAAGAYLQLDMTYKKNFASFPEPAIQASQDSAVIARGEYLANAVAHCSVCHQVAEGGMENRTGTKLNLDYGGGHTWDIPMFGRFVAANLTPDMEAGIGGLSDGTVARVVRNGLARDGYIAPFMAFAVGPMADEDLSAILSYLRTLKPIRNSRPPEKMGLFAKLVLKSMDPAKREPIPKWVKEGGVSVERGSYLANGPAMCFGCHSVADPMNGFALEGPHFQGVGQADPDPTDPAFEIAAPNLTPDPSTGHITKWTEEDFLKRFRGGIAFSGSPMPWESFARMTDDDVRSIYQYLRSLAPVRHETGPTRRAKGSWKPAKA